MPHMYYSETMMCRCNRTTKLYAKPTDIYPTISELLISGIVFVSEKRATSGTTTLREISYSPDGKSVPVGYWCPDTVLECYPIDTTETISDDSVSSDDSTTVNDTLYIKTTNIQYFDTKDSKTPNTAEIARYTSIIVDKKIRFNCNGEIQTRYHVVQSADDHLIDMWVLSNGNLTASLPVMKLNANIAPESKSVFDGADINEIGGKILAGVARPYVDAFRQLSDDERVAINSRDANSEFVGREGGGRSPASEDTGTNADGTAYGDITDMWGTYISTYDTPDVSLGNVPIGRMTFVHGMPFQYSYITDRRLGAKQRHGNDGASVNAAKGSDIDMYGRTFAKEIAGNMPIMVLIPGEPKYLSKSSGSSFNILTERSGSRKAENLFAPFWADLTDNEQQSALENIMSGLSGTEFDYFSFQINMTEFYKYANPTCRTAAALMGIQDRTIQGVKCNVFDWANYNKDVSQDYNVFMEVIGYGDGLSFAYDPLSSISDTISNSTTESQFATMLNGASQVSREIQFLMGQSSASGTFISNIFDASQFEGAVGNLTQGTGLINSIGGVLERVANIGTNIAKGFNMRFPDIWSDSSHTRSYDVDMHFITPYATAYCKWRYVLCPFLMLFALAAPIAPLSMSLYSRPFLIRAFSLGYFNVEMGIIESITWKRFGDGDMISQNGVPTQIDVSISFKDLYHVLTMGKTGTPANISAFFTNIGLMDMLGSLSGVNTNYLSLTDRVGLYMSTALSSFTSIPSNFMSNIQDRFHRVLDRYIYGF